MTAISASPCSALFATGALDGTIRLWNLPSEGQKSQNSTISECVWELRRGNGYVLGLAWSPNGSVIASSVSPVAYRPSRSSLAAAIDQSQSESLPMCPGNSGPATSNSRPLSPSSSPPLRSNSISMANTAVHGASKRSSVFSRFRRATDSVPVTPGASYRSRPDSSFATEPDALESRVFEFVRQSHRPHIVTSIDVWVMSLRAGLSLSFGVTTFIVVRVCEMLFKQTCIFLQHLAFLVSYC